jgi:hypothetical protein
MDGADGERERFGPVLRIAALAATLLALAAVIGPRLASSGSGGSTESSVAGSLPGGTGAAFATTTTTIAAAETSTTAAPPTTAVAATTSTTGTTVPRATTTTATAPFPVEVAPDSGAVDLALVGLHAGRYGPQRSGFFAGEAIAWHFRVTNTGGEYLWGVFVYLELYGPVSCSARRLDVGESADCWAETTAVAGSNEAEAWVTAWTDTRMVTDRMSYRVDAVAG